MTVSWWLESADDRVNRPALDGSVSADVAIVGAGFTGLWTAWYLKQREPGMKVVVIEAETAGFGASGRNGGWCVANLGITVGELARRTSPQVARQTIAAMRDTVDEVGRVCAAQQLDVDWVKGGILRVARGPAEVPAVDRSWQTLQDIGLSDGLARLDADQLARRVRVTDGQAAMFDPHGARLHPGKLVRGLARMAEHAGAVIYEHTPVRAIDRGRRLRTATGNVYADVTVLATEAWVARLPRRRRTVMPVYSLIVLTEPVDESRWSEIGWNGCELLASQRLTVDYLARTADGRILCGGRGAPYLFGSRIDPALDRHQPTHAALRRHLVGWFPALEGIAFTSEWGGPLAMPRDWMPTVHYDKAAGLAGAWGYTGQGVATANLAGRALADLITGTSSPLLELPFIGHRSRRWEPEPLRWLAVRYLQRSLARIDERSRLTGIPPTGRSLAERLTRH